MVAVQRKLKALLMALLSVYLVINVCHMLLSALSNERRSGSMEELLRAPLCRSHEEVIKRLKRLAKDLVYVRLLVDRDVTVAKQLERHHDNLQKLLREIEFIASGAKIDAGHQYRVEEDLKPSAEVCPEEYKGSTYGYPFYHKGFETTQCLFKKSIEKLVTFIFDGAPEPRAEHRNTTRSWDFLEDVFRLYPGAVVHAIFADWSSVVPSIIGDFSEKVVFHVVTDNSTKRDVWEDVVRSVDTPYALVAPGLERFTADANLERLVRVLSTREKTHIAGGSAVDRNGHWRSACAQTQLKNYTLAFREGYYHSMSECLVCDQLDAPFLVKIETLRELAVTSDFGSPPYWDLFLETKKRFGRNGHAVVTCPDVMFHAAPARKAREKRELAPFARKHEINKIVGADGNVTWFGCHGDAEASRECVFKSGLVVPPCCLENLATAVKFIMAQCERHGILCELQEGTLLGAVKLNKVLPWERDADITFLTSDFPKLQAISHVFSREGYGFREGGESANVCFLSVELSLQIRR